MPQVDAHVMVADGVVMVAEDVVIAMGHIVMVMSSVFLVMRDVVIVIRGVVRDMSSVVMAMKGVDGGRSDENNRSFEEQGVKLVGGQQGRQSGWWKLNDTRVCDTCMC